MQNAWRWTVLTLLHERPMHPYEMQRLTVARGKDLFVAHKPGSLYTVIAQLHRDGLIEEELVTREGRLPERTVYRITDLGRRTFEDWLREQLEQPSTRDLPRFVFAVEKLAHLDPAAVASLLTRRADAIETQLDDLDRVLDDAATREVPRVSLLEVDYARAIRRAELAWLRETLAALDDGELRWVPPGAATRRRERAEQ